VVVKCTAFFRIKFAKEYFSNRAFKIFDGGVNATGDFAFSVTAKVANDASPAFILQLFCGRPRHFSGFHRWRV
jgi:hypothetical protein